MSEHQVSATKDATDGHSRLPWKVVEHDFICSEDYTVAELTYCPQPKDERRANAQLIVTAVNERERLRQIAKDALRFREEMNGKCDHDEAMTKLCTQCEIRAALSDQKE